MNQSTQQQLLKALAELCDRSPDVRFGQLLAHIGFLAEDRGNSGLWEVDDQELLAAMRQHLDELSHRERPVAEQSDAPERRSRAN
jgi:hypothetical protein